MTQRQKKTTTPDSAIVSALKAELDEGKHTTSPFRVQLTEEDRAADARCKAWSRSLLARIVEAADATADCSQGRL